MSAYDKYFVFNGKRSDAWGVFISAGGTWNAPARRGEQIAIPGKNGDIWQDGGAFENYTVTYPCWIAEGFEDRIDDFRAFLLTHSDKYYSLWDNYRFRLYPTDAPTRYARFTGGFVAEPGTRNLTGRFDVSFDCQPMMPYYAGSNYIYTVENSNTFGIGYENTSEFTRYPVISFRGGWPGGSITITDNADYSETFTWHGTVPQGSLNNAHLYTEDMRLVGVDGKERFDYEYTGQLLFPPKSSGRLRGVADETFTRRFAVATVADPWSMI